MAKISIVMTYYNRQEQLYNTLKSLRFQHPGPGVEIVIVDDASDPDKKATSVTERFKSLNIRVIEVDKKEKYWINPSVPYNMGFKASSGSIIIIQNSECIHLGKVLRYAKRNIEKGKYLTFSCYSATKEQFERMCNRYSKKEDMEFLQDVVRTIHPLQKSQWYNHINFRPTRYHFASVILREDLERIGGGFNEDFAIGYCFEDNEFLFRLEQGSMDIKIVPETEGFVVHQWHKKSDTIIGRCPEWYRNKELLEKIMGKEYVEI